MNWKARYKEAHLLWYKTNRPLVVAAGHYLDPKIPEIEKTNGLTDYCVDMINFLGVGRVDRVNVVTRASDKLVKTESGAVFNDKRYTRSMRRGTADIIGSIRGTKLNIEIKNKYTKDTMKPHQWKEKATAEAALELYWIVTCVEDFLIQLDGFLYG
jgi:hypothetical protein